MDQKLGKAKKLLFFNEYKYLTSCPGAWLFHRGYKGGHISTKMGDSILKHLVHEAVTMSNEAEWYDNTNRINTKE